MRRIQYIPANTEFTYSANTWAGTNERSAREVAAVSPGAWRGFANNRAVVRKYGFDVWLVHDEPEVNEYGEVSP